MPEIIHWFKEVLLDSFRQSCGFHKDCFNGVYQITYRSQEFLQILLLIFLKGYLELPVVWQ